MSPLARWHDRFVFQRRVRVLGTALADLLDDGARVLDIGCGDGFIDKQIGKARPDLTISGIDVLLRPDTHIPVELFDGTTIPYGDASVDVVMFVDVLHHTDDPEVLLREARRVARRAIVLKDHTRDGLLAFLSGQKEQGQSIAAYGAPAKGNTLLNYCGIGTETIDFTVDRSPHKQGRFLPGSRIPIFSPEKIFEARPETVLILPWNLETEITEQMAGIRQWGGKFVVAIPETKVLD